MWSHEICRVSAQKLLLISFSFLLIKLYCYVAFGHSKLVPVSQFIDRVLHLCFSPFLVEIESNVVWVILY